MPGALWPGVMGPGAVPRVWGCTRGAVAQIQDKDSCEHDACFHARAGHEDPPLHLIRVFKVLS